MTIKLSIPDELDKCQACRHRQTKDRFCDLTLVDVGAIQFPICHDCALILVEELVGRYYALWGLVLVSIDPATIEGPSILSTILSELRAIRSHLYDQSTPDQDLPPDVEDALAGLGRGD